MGKWEQKEKKIKILAREYDNLKKQWETIKNGFKDCKLEINEKVLEFKDDKGKIDKGKDVKGRIDKGKNKLEFEFNGMKLFIDFVPEYSEENEFDISGKIRFGAYRKKNTFKKDKPAEHEQEIFVSFDFYTTGMIKGQAGTDDEWFFENLDKNKGMDENEKRNIKEILICALDFMLLSAIDWINKGA